MDELEGDVHGLTEVIIEGSPLKWIGPSLNLYTQNSTWRPLLNALYRLYKGIMHSTLKFQNIGTFIFLSQLKWKSPPWYKEVIEDNVVGWAGQPRDIIQAQPIPWGIGNNCVLHTDLYKSRNAVLQATQSPSILTNPKSSSSSQNACRHCKRAGHWKQNCPALKRKTLNSNDPRYLIIGKYTPKLLGENLDTFSVPLRCTFSTLIFSRT